MGPVVAALVSLQKSYIWPDRHHVPRGVQELKYLDGVIRARRMGSVGRQALGIGRT